MAGRNYIGSVTRDDVFFYDYNGLYVVENGRHYTRALDSDLHDLLTWVDEGPVLTKKGVPAKRQPPPHKDETAAFYIAQLMHYGLKPLKTKPAAKNALLAAFDGGESLAVPRRIVDLESELKELWRVENEKGRVRYKQQRKEGAKKEGERRADQKRKQEAILAQFSDDTSHAGPSRKRKRRAAGSDEDAPKKKKVKAGGSGKTVRLKLRCIPSAPLISNPLKLPDTECKGKFAIAAPYLVEGWPDTASGDLKLTISPSPATGNHLWGSFDFGVIKGVLRGKAPPTAAGGTVDFVWRGSDAVRRRGEQRHAHFSRM